MERTRLLIHFGILSCFISTGSCIWLYFPRYTVLQVTMAMVMPYEHPQFKLNMNMGIQCNYGLPWNSTEFTNPTHWAQRDLHSPASNDTRFKRDLTGGEFYTVLEELALQRGYHSSCIMKSVCEMAQHPLEFDEDNVLTMGLHYIFTPSAHDSFETHEKETSNRFRRAEKLGRSGKCEEVFRDCPTSPLADMSYLDSE